MADTVSDAHTDHFTLRQMAEGQQVVDFSRASEEAIKDAAYDVMTEENDAEDISEFNHRYPVAMIAQYASALRHYTKEELPAEALASLLTVLDEANARIDRVYQQRLEQGMVEMDHLRRLFPIDAAVVLQGEHPIAGTLKEIKVEQGFYGPFVSIKIEVIHAMRGIPERGIFQTKLQGFKGTRAIASLPLQVLNDARRDQLSARGELFVKYLKPGTYVDYRGAIIRDSWWGPTEFRADGRVVIDSQSFRRIDSNQWRETANQSGVDDPDEGEASATCAIEVDAGERWMCMPWLYGFSMSAKQWGRMTVASMFDIRWRDDAFDFVVMPEKQKRMIHALVKHHGVGFNDVIDGKGGGCIFLLHGEPGGGKTLVSESVAEVLHKPLYSVSVGELGTNPDLLEQRLRAILDVATAWDAVILLDEADIFLEARDQSDVARNAMVGVFLRMLEYHNGVLFMTTNRVKNIDKAFYSRISVAMRFGHADADKRTKIWHNLLTLCKLDTAWAKELGDFNINGRQIKNCIRLAQTLAISEDRSVGIADLKEAINQAVAFEENLKSE